MAEASWRPEPRHRARSARVLALVFLTFAGVVGPRPLAAHVAQVSLPDLAAIAPHVVVAVVESRNVRWNAQHTLLVTDYALRIEERLRGQAPDRFSITVPGGTLGNITDDTCLTVSLDPGARYLLFLERLDRPSLTPVSGAWQGMVRETADRLAAAGKDSEPLKIDGRPVRFSDLVAAVRPMAAKAIVPPSPPAHPSVALPAKTWNPASRPAPDTVSPRLASTAEVPQSEPPTEKYIYHELAQSPITMNPLPAGSPFSPWDQREMALWNLYAGDLFRVTATPTSDWAYGNGVSDIAGFPPDDQMVANFGMTWGESGNSTLAITISHAKDGVITEADVALNPNWTWTADEVLGRHYFSPYPFQEIILHELGHVWGLHHPTENGVKAGWDSVMHVKDRHYYVEELFPDDTTAVRAAFPPGVSLRDGLISSYTTFWNDLGFVDFTPATPSVPSIRPGRTFHLTAPIKIENPGTVPLQNPLVEIYLAPRQWSFTGAVLLKRVRVQATVPAGSLQILNVGTLRVPSGTRAGTYYLAFFLRDHKDIYQANNGAWSNDDVTLKVTR